MKVTKRNRTAAIVVIMLAFVMAFAACGSGGGGGEESGKTGESATEKSADTAKDAYALFDSASKALSAAEGYSMDMSMSMITDIDGEKMETNSTSQAIVSDPAGNIGMKTTQTMDLQGQAVDSVVYIKDGNMYTDSLGQKLKMPIGDISQFIKQQTSLFDFPEDALIGGSVTDVDGGKEIELTIKGDAISDYISQAAGGLTSGITDATGADEDVKLDEGQGNESANDEGQPESDADEAVSGAGLEDILGGMEFGDFKITARVGSDGNFIEYATEMSFGIEAEGYKTSMVQNTNVTNIQLGKVTIDYPDDLDSYQDISGALGDLDADLGLDADIDAE
jgi:hypothetical protein